MKSVYMVYLTSGTNIKIFTTEHHELREMWEALRNTDNGVYYSEDADRAFVVTHVVAMRQMTKGS